MLTFGSPDSFGHIFGRCLEAVEDMGLSGRGQVARHRFGGARGRDMLEHGPRVSAMSERGGEGGLVGRLDPET